MWLIFYKLYKLYDRIIFFLFGLRTFMALIDMLIPFR